MAQWQLVSVFDGSEQAFEYLVGMLGCGKLEVKPSYLYLLHNEIFKGCL